MDKPNIAPAILPFRREKYNVEALVAGWGLDESHQYPENLKKQNVVNVPANLCEEVFKYKLENDDSMCAHKNDNKGFGACDVSVFLFFIFSLLNLF